MDIAIIPKRLILIRGNSGSGKSTVAARIREELDEQVLSLQQDFIRQNMLKKIQDEDGNPGVGLVKHLLTYGQQQGFTVILEGILSNLKYGEMLREFIATFDKSYVYYFDIPFEETLRRHTLRHKVNDFGEDEMRDWWKEKDYLNVPGERILGQELSEDEVVELILKDVEHS